MVHRLGKPVSDHWEHAMWGPWSGWWSECDICKIQHFVELKHAAHQLWSQRSRKSPSETFLMMQDGNIQAPEHLSGCHHRGSLPMLQVVDGWSQHSGRQSGPFASKPRILHKAGEEWVSLQVLLCAIVISLPRLRNLVILSVSALLHHEHCMNHCISSGVVQHAKMLAYGIFHYISFARASYPPYFIFSDLHKMMYTFRLTLLWSTSSCFTKFCLELCTLLAMHMLPDHTLHA